MVYRDTAAQSVTCLSYCVSCLVVTSSKRGVLMLWTLSVIFLSLWILGVTTPFTLHGYIHVLLILAIAAVLIPFIQKKHPVD